jgi:hypothetical protein
VLPARRRTANQLSVNDFARGTGRPERQEDVLTRYIERKNLQPASV